MDSQKGYKPSNTEPVKIRNLNWIILLSLIALSAVLSLRNTSEAPVSPTDTSYSVDGVSLGIGIEEVRATWGELEPHYSFNGQLWLAKPGESPLTGNSVRFDYDKKVISVRGHRLRRGNRLILGPNHDYHQSLGMGSELELERPGCGYPYVFMETRRDLGKEVVEVLHYNLEGLYDRQSMAYDPDFPRTPEVANVLSIHLCDKEVFEHPLGVGGEERLTVYANFVIGCRGIKQSYEADGLSITLTRLQQHFLETRFKTGSPQHPKKPENGC